MTNYEWCKSNWFTVGEAKVEFNKYCEKQENCENCLVRSENCFASWLFAEHKKNKIIVRGTKEF